MTVKKQKAKYKIINLDDPDLVLPELSDEDTEENYSKQNIVKNKVKGTKKLFEKVGREEIDIENINIKDKKNIKKIENVFNYNGNNIVVVVDKQKKVWCKGKDVAIYLEYTNTKGALSRHISEKNKKSYADIGDRNTTPYKIDPQTIFISQAGVLQLVLRSKKPNAEAFAEWLTEEVIPTLMETGTYTMPPKESDVNRLNKSFYDDNMLSDWHNKGCVYLAYIGKFGGKHLLKFGQSTDFPRRELIEHRKDFNTFNVLKIWETLAPKTVEANIKTNFASKHMITTNKIRGKNNKVLSKKELIALDEINDLDYCFSMIESVVKNTYSPLEEELHDKIKELEHKNELLEMENIHLKEMNQQLKEHIQDLKN